VKSFAWGPKRRLLIVFVWYPFFQLRNSGPGQPRPNRGKGWSAHFFQPATLFPDGGWTPPRGGVVNKGPGHVDLPRGRPRGGRPTGGERHRAQGPRGRGPGAGVVRPTPTPKGRRGVVWDTPAQPTPAKMAFPEILGHAVVFVVLLDAPRRGKKGEGSEENDKLAIGRRAVCSLPFPTPSPQT